MNAVIVGGAFALSLVVGAQLYVAWLRVCRRACDACRLNEIGNAHPSIPHSCPFASLRHGIVVRGGRVVEFGTPVHSNHDIRAKAQVKNKREGD